MNSTISIRDELDEPSTRKSTHYKEKSAGKLERWFSTEGKHVDMANKKVTDPFSVKTL